MSDKKPPKKFQVQERPKTMKVVNNSLADDLFDMNADEFKKLLAGENRKFLEASKTKHGAIESKYWLKYLDEADDSVKIARPLDEYDRDILNACITAQDLGNEVITATGIWRIITGNADAEPTEAVKKEILDRVDRMSITRLIVDTTDAHNAGLYAPETKIKLKSVLLPCEVIECEINGQLVDAAVVFTKSSPLLRIARDHVGKKKNTAQILSYPLELLEVKGQRNTPTTTAIKNYIVRRVENAKKHPSQQRSILFSTLFARCGLADADRFKRRECRKIAEDVMKSLVEKKEIAAFELVKEQGEFIRITFSF